MKFHKELDEMISEDLKKAHVSIRWAVPLGFGLESISLDHTSTSVSKGFGRFN
jgi:hypothetical protein